jgi:Ca-activated chloride channel family protein
VTPYTSYLALEPEAAARNVSSLPVNGRFGVGSAGRGANAPAPPKVADMKAITGAVAVQQSKRAREQQEADRLDKDTASSAIRNAGGKTFYLREGVWTDSEFKTGAKLRETIVKFGSDDYFALLKQEPRLAQFFSLGERVIVVFEGRLYRVNAAN